LDLHVASRVKSCEVTAQAGPDERSWLAAEHVVQDTQLAADGQLFELALIE
jgi:hypothetical protein